MTVAWIRGKIVTILTRMARKQLASFLQKSVKTHECGTHACKIKVNIELYHSTFREHSIFFTT